MQIQCPNCKYTGNIADKLVPDEGRNVGCPRCKERFHIEKPLVPAVVSNETFEIERTAYDQIPSRPQQINITMDNTDVIRAQAQMKSYTGWAFVVLVLYLFPITVPIGFVMNLVFLNETSKLKRAFGVAPNGHGCMTALMIIAIIPIIVLFLVLVRIAA